MTPPDDFRIHLMLGGSQKDRKQFTNCPGCYASKWMHLYRGCLNGVWFDNYYCSGACARPAIYKELVLRRLTA